MSFFKLKRFFPFSVKKILPKKGNGSSKYSSTYYYSSVLEKYESVTSYLNIFDKCLSRPNVKTNQHINFSDKINFGATIKQVKKIKPNPTKSVNVNNNCHILFYKTKIGNIRTNLELHFFSNKLFFYSYSFSNTIDTDKILDLLKEKYLSVKSDVNLNFHNITDEFNNYVLVNNEMDLTIKYVALRDETYNYLNQVNIIEKAKTKHIKKLENKELLSKL